MLLSGIYAAEFFSNLRRAERVNEFGTLAGGI
jgi:hypothetical protein